MLRSGYCVKVPITPARFIDHLETHKDALLNHNKLHEHYYNPHNQLRQ